MKILKTICGSLLILLGCNIGLGMLHLLVGQPYYYAFIVLSIGGTVIILIGYGILLLTD